MQAIAHMHINWANARYFGSSIACAQKLGADPCFLVRGVICTMYKCVRVRLIFLKYPMKMKKFGLSETKLFHFHRIFKNREREGFQATPLNPLWIRHCAYCNISNGTRGPGGGGTLIFSHIRRLGPFFEGSKL